MMWVKFKYFTYIFRSVDFRYLLVVDLNIPHVIQSSID